MTDNRTMITYRNERGVIIDWFIKIVVALALLAVVAYDGGSIVVNYFGADNVAEEIATTISTEIAGGTDMNNVQIEARARDLAKERDTRLIEATIDADGVLNIKVRKKADTLVIGRISALEDWAKATGEARATTRQSA